MAGGRKAAPEGILQRSRVAAGTPSRTAARLPRPGRRLPRVGRAIASVPAPLALLLIVGLVEAISWNLAVPAFQGPDEAGHFAYVQHLAETGSIPRATGGGKPASAEQEGALTWLNLGALIGNTRARPAWSRADLDLWRRVDSSLPPGSRNNGSGPNPLAKNPPLYYAVMAVPYRLLVWLPVLKRLFLLRAVNALFLLATIALVWQLAGELFSPIRWKQTLATAVVALQPQLGFMSAVINADNLLITLTTAVLLVSLRLVTRGPTPARVLTAGGLTAAAVLTHGRGLVTIPVLLTGLVVGSVKHRVALAPALARGATAAAAIGGALLAYVLFGRPAGSPGLYGGQANELNAGRGFKFGQFLSSIYQFYLPKLSSQHRRIGPPYGYRQVFIDTFYGGFGSLEVGLRARLNDALQVTSGLGLVGLYTGVVVRWRRIWHAWPKVIVMLALLVTNLVFLHYVSYRALLNSNGEEPLIVGRYLLPMVALFGLAIAFTVGTLPRRVGPLAAAAILATGALLSLTAIGITMVRFYS